MAKIEAMKKICKDLGVIVGQGFDVIECVEPGVPSPLEALSKDHMIGVYFDAIPMKMTAQLSGFREARIHELLPRIEDFRGNPRELFLEMEGMRGCRFQAASLQYLEEDWAAYADEVKYLASDVMGCAYYMGKTFGGVHIYLNDALPMPLWMRPAPISETLEPECPQIAIQARSLDRPIFTNIHTVVSMEYARRWAAAARGYYKTEL
jgi:hypothetical protein